MFLGESVEEFNEIRSILGACTKIYWNSKQHAQGFNSEDKLWFVIEGLDPDEWSTCKNLWPYYSRRRKVLASAPKSIGRSSIDRQEALELEEIILPTASGEIKVNIVQVYVPGRLSAIGKLEFRPKLFSRCGEDLVVITNYTTNETFRVSLSSYTHASCPAMDVISAINGQIVATCQIHYFETSQGTSALKSIEAELPSHGMAATTKALILAFGTVCQMNARQTSPASYMSKASLSWIWFIVLLLISAWLFGFMNESDD